MSDVCLILEGTYPFVAGGVSTWIHQLIKAMPEVRFSILLVSPYPNPHREFKYKLPPNVLHIQDLYLHELPPRAKPTPPEVLERAVEALGEAQEAVINGGIRQFGEALRWLRGPDAALTFDDVFRSPQAWRLFERAYRSYAGDASFLDFFWTFRSIYIPMLKTLQCPLPKARLYHTVSTGYAGLLACVAKCELDAPVLLTEHGVYTHERLLEISQSTWIYSPRQERFRIQSELSLFKRIWLGFFSLMGRLTYHHADKVITLFDGNRVKQIAAGAPPEAISIIPNGIDIAHYRGIRLKLPQAGPKTVAFVGRVVPIKDVKTFIQSAATVLLSRPDTRFVVVGPLDEDAEYAQECRDLTRHLRLEHAVEFKGKADMSAVYPEVDLVVLTSLSEAQPYVILEANAIGIPVVASDVGACRELLEGRTEDDRRIGPSGLLTGVSNPELTGQAVLKLLEDERLWRQMSEAGRNRTLRFYDQDDLISRYLNLYEQMMR